MNTVIISPEKQYVLNTIDPDCYDNPAESDREKLQFLWETFNVEFVYPDNLKRFKTLENCFAEWIPGLPGAFSPHFYPHEILGIGWAWNFDLSTEDKESDFLDNWFKLLAKIVFQLFKEYQIKE